MAMAAAMIMALTWIAFPGPARAEGRLDEIRARGRLRVAVFADNPPFGAVDANGLFRGYDVFLAHRLAQDLLGDPELVDFVGVRASERAEVLVSGQVDMVLANYTVTPERAEVVDFAKPYMKVTLGVASPSWRPIADLRQLAGRKLIVVAGTTAESFFQANHPDIELVTFLDNATAFKALRDGQGAAAAHDNTVLLAWIREVQGFVVAIPSIGDVDYIAPAVRKGDTELLDWLNDEIERLTREQFFFADYEDTVLPYYGYSIDARTLLITE
jgi:polar amino acid transport system substrate-binding protein